MKMNAGSFRVLGTGAILSTLVVNGTGCGFVRRVASVFHRPAKQVSVSVNDPEKSAPVGPRWSDEPVSASKAASAKSVNVFGEIAGTPAAKFVDNSGGEFQQHTTLDEGEDGDVAVDPTGHWIAFSSTRHSEGGDIYVQRIDGTSVTQLTNDAARDAYPTFSPDGKWVAFASTRSGNWQIYRVDLDGRNVAQVTNGAMQSIHPSFSPDGSRLVYCALSVRNPQWELWTANLTTGERKQIGSGLFPTWSPDRSSDRIAFQRARQRGSRMFSLWTMDIVEGEGRRLTEVAVSSNAAIVSPCWSPDGRKLAFSTVVQDADETAIAQQDIWTVDADGTNKRRLTDGNGSSLTPAWGADNRVFFVSNRSGSENIWSVQAQSAETFTAKADDEQKNSEAEAHVETGEVAQ
jgi:TolB protein